LFDRLFEIAKISKATGLSKNNHCMERNILLDYLKKHASEVVNMLYHEFNMEDALAVRYAEGAAKERSYIKSLLEQGLSREELLKKFEDRQNPLPCR
jgi:hypothetical protein